MLYFATFVLCQPIHSAWYYNIKPIPSNKPTPNETPISIPACWIRYNKDSSKLYHNLAIALANLGRKKEAKVAMTKSKDLVENKKQLTYSY